VEESDIDVDIVMEFEELTVDWMKVWENAAESKGYRTQE
jgi:hypothetical protein